MSRRNGFRRSSGFRRCETAKVKMWINLSAWAWNSSPSSDSHLAPPRRDTERRAPFWRSSRRSCSRVAASEVAPPRSIDERCCSSVRKSAPSVLADSLPLWGDLRGDGRCLLTLCCRHSPRLLRLTTVLLSIWVRPPITRGDSRIDCKSDSAYSVKVGSLKDKNSPSPAGAPTNNNVCFPLRHAKSARSVDWGIVWLAVDRIFAITSTTINYIKYIQYM